MVTYLRKSQMPNVAIHWKVICFLLVPLKIKYGNNGKQTTTLEMFDICNYVTFVHEAILK